MFRSFRRRRYVGPRHSRGRYGARSRAAIYKPRSKRVWLRRPGKPLTFSKYKAKLGRVALVDKVHTLPDVGVYLSRYRVPVDQFRKYLNRVIYEEKYKLPDLTNRILRSLRDNQLTSYYGSKVPDLLYDPAEAKDGRDAAHAYPASQVL